MAFGTKRNTAFRGQIRLSSSKPPPPPLHPTQELCHNKRFIESLILSRHMGVEGVFFLNLE